MPAPPDPDFDPRRHWLTPQRWFEDFACGERYALPSRTVTEAHYSAFQALSGDNHPIHYDTPFCQAHGHAGALAHGLQVLCFTAAGAGLFPHEASESLVAFLEQSSRFLAPVHAGDTLYPTLVVAALKAQRSTGVLTMASRVHNQHGVVVLDGEQRYLLRMRPLV